MEKFAIVGDGEAAKLHAKSIQRKGGRLLAVCGSDEAETDALAAACNAKAYRSFDELLNAAQGLDVVVVCSPVGFHAEHIIKSLQAGKDVLCESPLCLTKAAAWQIIETEKYCQRRVYLIQTPRFYFPFTHLKKDFGGHVYGTTHSFSLTMTVGLPLHFVSGIQGKRFPGGGLLYAPFGPFIDLLISFFGELETAEGFASTVSGESAGEVESHGAAALKMRNGIFGTLQWSDVSSTARPATFTLVADSGVAEAQLDERNLLQMQANDGVSEALTTQLYEAVYDDLLKSLQGEDVAFPGTIEGAKTVEAIEKIYKALR